MNGSQLLNRLELEASSVVANCCMNRERDLRGSNGYAVELLFDPIDWLLSRVTTGHMVHWLDLCCGTGKALIQAASLSCGRPVQIVGVDLVDMFLPHNSKHLSLLQTSVFDFHPSNRYDLITSVHGFHYLGDKLRAIELATSWLTHDGLFVANIDLKNVCISATRKKRRTLLPTLRSAGFEYLPRKRLLRRTGQLPFNYPFKFLGADDAAGPNYTKQPVVNSHYECSLLNTSKC